MPIFTNLGFEVAGSSPGSAAGWIYSFLAQAQAIDPISPVPWRPAEDFERDWLIDGYVTAFGPTALAFALFSTPSHPFENFESGWQTNEGYSFTLQSSSLAHYGPSAKSVENFEEGWHSNESFFFVLGTIEQAIYNSTMNPFEEFEREWESNQNFTNNYALNVAPIADPLLSIAFYYQGLLAPQAVEDFERPRPDVQATFNVGTSELFCDTSHLTDGSLFTLHVGPEGGVLPAGLFPGIIYYVVNRSGVSVQIARDFAGAPIAFTSSGLGALFLQHETDQWWTLIMETI